MRTPSVAVLGALAALLVLAGCGRYPARITAPGGADGAVGRIEVLDARFSASPPRAGDEAYPAGADAPLTLTIVNTGDAADRLESVTSPVAEGFRMDGDPQILGGFALASGYEDEPAQTLSATVRTDITLTGLREPVRAGLTYPVRFSFARAGTVMLELPVGNPDALPPRAGDAAGALDPDAPGSTAGSLPGSPGGG